MPTHHHGKMREILDRCGILMEERENMVVAIDGLLAQMVTDKTAHLTRQVNQLQAKVDQMDAVFQELMGPVKQAA